MSQKVKILVVDDDPDVLFATSHVVKSSGYTAFEAKDGKECMEAIETYSPDLVLLDIVLPDADGRDLAKRIKANPKLGQPFIVLLSSQKISSEDKVKGFETGADGYIVRPVSNKVLKAQVDAYVRIKKVEKALVESEALFRTTIYSIGDAVITTDIKGNVDFLNPEAESLTGWITNDAKGKKLDQVFRIINEESRLMVENPVELVLRDSSIVGLAQNTLLISKQGNEIPISDSAAPIKGDTGEIIGVVLVFRDEIEERKAKETLAQRAREMSALYNLSGIVFGSLSEDQVASEGLKGLIHATQASTAFLLMREGDDLIPRKVVFSKPYSEFTDFPTHKLGECLCGMAVRERRPVFSENLFIDKRCTWEECKQAGIRSAAALPLFQGDEIFAVLGLGSDTARNFGAQSEFLETLAREFSNGLHNARLYTQAQKELTQRRQVEKALKTSEEKFRTISEGSLQGIVIVQGSELQYANPAFENLFGYSIAELNTLLEKERIGKTLREDFETVSQYFLALMAEKDIPENLEYRIIRKDGTVRWVDSRTAIIEFQGNPAFLSSFVDITERKEAEQALKDLNAELDKRVKERTSELNHFVHLMSGREIRMAELKKVITKLRTQIFEAGMTPEAFDPLLGPDEEW